MSFEAVSSRVDFPDLERRILDFWREHDVFRRSVEQRPEAELYVFYEGPPTANGRPGIHHVLARAFKDAIPRYQTMRGKRVPRKGGWDTHGLPVELEIERELGFRSKSDIEAFGIEEFNRLCRESVMRYVEEWERMTERIGFWIDMDDPYITYENRYIETAWWILRTLWDHGLIYESYKSVPHCPRCGTTLSDHEVAQGYREDTPDPSVHVKFALLPAGEQPRPLPAALRGDARVCLLAWTTTPWTLPGNTALAVQRPADYAVVEVAGGERLVVAEALREAAVGPEAPVVAHVQGADLVDLRYAPLYDPTEWGVAAMRFAPDGRLTSLQPGERAPARRVIAAEFVSLEDGTGIVHVAPAFGGEDFEAGRTQDLLFTQPVDLRGNMTGGPWAGRFVKDADAEVLDDLRARGLLWRAGTIRHTYPFCWRCQTPLLYYAKPSWYVRTTAVKESLLANNERVNWYPEHIKHGRFGDWLANNVDWALSRERYWGTPLPIWQCGSCDTQRCVGSVAELRTLAADPTQVDALTDLHRPYIDVVELRCPRCGGLARRVLDVIDCWFDSGAMPYAQWHYPFENQETFQRRFPADFICEAVDQTRGWFYTLHAEATLLNACEAVPAGHAFRNVICLGHILDARGEKMSTSRRNAVDPWEVLDEHGADGVRWYLYTATPAGTPRRFSHDLVRESVRRFLLTLWNSYVFFVTYANIDGYSPDWPDGRLAEIDRWILAELQLLVQRVTAEMDAYNPTDAGRAIQDFVDDLSNWYVRRSRRRFWKSEDDDDKRAAFHTLYRCLVTVSLLCAPLIPFTSEALWQNLVRRVQPRAAESVHLADWPPADPTLLDERLIADTRLAMRIASLGRAARQRAGIRVRQPLARMLVRLRSPAEAEGLQRVLDQVSDELNVREVKVVEDESPYVSYRVRLDLKKLGPRLGRELPAVQRELAALDPAEAVRRLRAGRLEIAGQQLAADEVLVDLEPRPGWSPASEGGYFAAVATEVTPDLLEEGLAREVTFRLQNLRKDAGFDVADRIDTWWEADGAVARALERHGAWVAAETLSRHFERGMPPDGATLGEWTVDGQAVRAGVRRVMASA